MTIHPEHPFRDPDGERRTPRRLRGRLPAPVTVWTAGEGAGRAGLTVSSMLVADGEPARLIALLDEEADLCDRLRETGRAAVSLLGPDDGAVADVLAGAAPSPGGPFRTGRWNGSPWGPVLDGRSWVGGSLAAEPRVVGWSVLVELTLDQVELLADLGALAYRRGAYVRLVAGQPRR